jgi:hypothetical protein
LASAIRIHLLHFASQQFRHERVGRSSREITTTKEGQSCSGGRSARMNNGGRYRVAAVHIAEESRVTDRRMSAVPKKSRYGRWLESVVPYPKPLAWCHTTNAFAFRDIVACGFLTPQRCHVFGEDLIYFFYGRPAYRDITNEPLRFIADSPVVVVLDPSLVTSGVRLHPFDTGAFDAKRYANWIHPRIPMRDYQLACPSDAPQRHVASLFGSNADYLRARARPPSVPFKGEFEVDSLVAMLTDRDAGQADDRRAAVELQVPHAVPMKWPYVRGLIIPDEIMDAEYVQQLLQSAGGAIDVQTYERTPLKAARDYQALLEHQAALLQARWGLG